MINRDRIVTCIRGILIFTICWGLMYIAINVIYQLWNLPSKPATYQHDNKPACECAKEAK